MPLKRTPRIQRETREARALRAAVIEATDEMLARMPAPTVRERRKDAKRAARFAARVERDGLDVAMNWQISKLRPAARPVADAYVVHHEMAVRAAVVSEAVRAAHTPEEAPAVAEPPTAKKRRTPRPTGFAGYIDPSLFDADEWED